MAVEKLFLILLMMALSGSHSMQNDTDRIFVLSNGQKLKIKTIESIKKITISCPTDSDEPVILQLNKIENINLSPEYSDIIIENCLVVEGFGALIKCLGIKEAVVTLQATNAGHESFEVDFPSGFGKVENLLLSSNQIIKLNGDTFQSLPQLSTLDLSNNEIDYLPENLFRNLTKLKTLKLHENRLKLLHAGMFKDLKSLTVLTLGNNWLTSLTNEIFQGLDSLEELSLEGNHLRSLTDDLFSHIPQLFAIGIGYGRIKLPYNIFANSSRLQYVFIQKVEIDNNGLNLTDLVELDIKWSVLRTISGLSNIQNISITDSVLYSLPNNSFENTSVVTFVDLSSNQIPHLDDGLFSNLTNLERLLLTNNHLTEISQQIFGDLRSLIEIDLSDNRLTTIHPDAFANAKQLEIINLKNNQLTFTNNNLPFIHLIKLRNLFLSSNHLTRMPSELTLQLPELTELDISYNNITTLKFSELRNVNINFTHETLITSAGSNIVTYLSGNPLECDCSMYNFLLGTDQEKLAVAFGYRCSKFNYNLTPCYRQYYTGPAKWPAECECSEIAIGTELLTLISCEGRGLITVPEVYIQNATTLQLNISRNSLTELPKLQSDLQAIVIQASYNKISTIEMDDLPPNLRALDVSHNHIRTIAVAVLNHVTNHKSLEIILLIGNPFSCDCSPDMDKLVEFANATITDLQGAKCDDNKYDLKTKTLDDKCNNDSIIKKLIVAVALAIMVMISGFLSYKHQEPIKLWLFDHHCCLWWIDEEYVDRDKEFDAFISYAHEDADYAHRLVHRLENCTQRFRLCVHERDFLGGGSILTSIMDSVNKSRRTIVILTENFLNSPWANYEFDYAYSRSIDERRNRLIVIKIGDIENGVELDTNIKAYIDTYTYIASSNNPDDPDVFKKVLFALPRKNLNRNRNNGDVNENRNENGNANVNEDVNENIPLEEISHKN